MSIEVATFHDFSQLNLPNYNQFIIGKWVNTNNGREIVPFDHRTEMPSHIDNDEIYTDVVSASLAASTYDSEYNVGFVLTKNDNFFLIKVDISNETIEAKNNDSSYLKKLFPDSFSWLSVDNSKLFIMGVSHNLANYVSKNNAGVELILDNYVIAIDSLKNAHGNPLSDCSESLDLLLKSNYFPDASHLNHPICDSEETIDAIKNITTEFNDLESIECEPLMDLNGDQFHDANRIIDTTFNNKLIALNNKLHFYNGREAQPLEDSVARRFIGLTMGGGRVRVTQPRIVATYALMKDQIPNAGQPDPVDSKVYFLNGVFNLKTNEIEEHNIENKNTRTLSVDYSESSECPKFIKWLNDIFEGEVERVEYLQEVLGWTLCRGNLGIEKAIMMIGPTRAGKGIVLKIIRALLGKGAISLNLGELDDNKRLSALMNAHIAIDSDAVGPSKNNAKAVMGIFKVISSNEPVGVKHLYIQTPVEGPLNCKLCIAANSAPIMFDNSAATANRWLPLVFNKSFLGREDPHLFKVLKKELAGIASWALLGLKRLIDREKFILPKSSLTQIDLLISDSGNIHDFISEELTINKDLRCRESEVWDRYVLWAFREGHDKSKRPLIIKSIEDAMRSQGVKRAKSIKMPDGLWDRGFYGIKPKNKIIPMNVSNFNLPS
tara:strand:+ start:4758 stop:6746 length:1989 start_codon:yes stop_codon:yes gene_type:complete